MMAVVLMCVLMVSALQFSTADKSSAEMEAKFKSFFNDFGSVEANFKTCSAACHKKCADAACRNKCDADCGKKEVESTFFYLLDKNRFNIQYQKMY